VVWHIGVTSPILLAPRNLDNVEAGWGQVLVPRVLALLTGLVAEVRWAPLGEGVSNSCVCGKANPPSPSSPHCS
jgi:hypothetical protein